MKIHVNVYIPAIAESYDVLIPNSLSVREISSLIAESIEYLSSHRYVSSGKEVICLAEQNLLLRADQTLVDYNIKNGDHLVII